MVPSKSLKHSRSNLTDLMLFRNRWWQHLLFWGVALLILFNIFKSSGSVKKIDVIYTLIFLLPIVSIVYLNLPPLYTNLRGSTGCRGPVPLFPV